MSSWSSSDESLQDSGKNIFEKKKKLSMVIFVLWTDLAINSIQPEPEVMT